MWLATGRMVTFMAATYICRRFWLYTVWSFCGAVFIELSGPVLTGVVGTKMPRWVYKYWSKRAHFDYRLKLTRVWVSSKGMCLTQILSFRTNCDAGCSYGTVGSWYGRSKYARRVSNVMRYRLYKWCEYLQLRGFMSAKRAEIFWLNWAVLTLSSGKKTTSQIMLVCTVQRRSFSYITYMDTEDIDHENCDRFVHIRLSYRGRAVKHTG